AARSEAIRANEIALEGVRQEAEVGSRTTLDVLDAEQELLDSRVALVIAERDEYVAGYQLLAAIGRLTAAHIALPVQIYDPNRHYQKVRNKWWGWNTEKD
ncbi:MAG: TolC family protein, partial [Rhodospirillaceae bacterium]|nr:TolC family protein [Rhodospirillaceae bacterium]